MIFKMKKKKELTEEQKAVIETKDFFDRTVPGVIKFYPEYYICTAFIVCCFFIIQEFFYHPSHICIYYFGIDIVNIIAK